MAMDMCIARVKGVVNSCILFDPEEQLALVNPTEYAEKLSKGTLKAKYYKIEVIQFTSEKSLPVIIKDFDIDQPVRESFTNFDENCRISPWGVGGRNGYTLAVYDGILREVLVSEKSTSKKVA